MDLHPATTSIPPPRLFQSLPRLLPHPPAPPSKPPPHPPPSDLTLQALTPSTLPSFKRLTTLLFPIRYHASFFTDILSDPTTSSLSRIAIWRSSPRPTKRKRPPNDADSSDSAETEEEAVVVGGIRCRLEDFPSGTADAQEGRKQLYVQTLGVLSPYRSLGVGSALLEEVVRVGMREYGIGGVYAHVWEANEEGLEWYLRRGFGVEEGLVEGYYRRLRPAGARVVRRAVGIGEYVRVGRRGAVGSGEGVEGWAEGGGGGDRRDGGEGGGGGGGDEHGDAGDGDTPERTGWVAEEPGGIGDEVDRAPLDHVTNDARTTSI